MRFARRTGKLRRVCIPADRFQGFHLAPHFSSGILAAGDEVPHCVPTVHFGVQRVANRAVELVHVSSAKHHAEVIAIRPVALAAQLFSHQIVELGVRQGIGERHSDIVRPRFANQRDRLSDVLPRFAGISELKEKAGLNLLPAKILARRMDLLDEQPLVHGVQDLL